MKKRYIIICYEKKSQDFLFIFSICLYLQGIMTDNVYSSFLQQILGQGYFILYQLV